MNPIPQDGSCRIGKVKQILGQGPCGAEDVELRCSAGKVVYITGVRRKAADGCFQELERGKPVVMSIYRENAAAPA